jgi:branched-subunit amino acid aminotransferase/4-amino-4-deoxychorismate lyase
MEIVDITRHAQRMYAQAGREAIAIAARKAQECSNAGETEAAEDWRRIRLCLLERAGPRAT